MRQRPTLTSIDQLFLTSLKIMIRNYDLVLLFYFLPFLISIFGSQLLNVDHLKSLHNLHLNNRQLIGAGLIALWLAISIVNYPATLAFRLRAAQGKPKLAIQSYYRQGFSVFLKVWAVQIIATLLIFAGLALFIVPGLLLLRRFGLAPFYALDKKNSIVDSLRLAADQTKPYQFGVIQALVFTTGFQLVVTLVITAGLGLIAYLILLSVLFIPALCFVDISKVRTVKN